MLVESGSTGNGEPDRPPDPFAFPEGVVPRQLKAGENLKEILEAQASTGEFVETALSTDKQVFARITDGIYRKPASALRELISNAYDADAEHVHVLTDPPRFGTMVVRDDGNGMNEGALANLIERIGGSLKRRDRGEDLGVTHPDDPSLSPGGRKLIGKIGIGLYSISQITHRFIIVTKRAKTRKQLIAYVVLKQYNEDELRTMVRENQYETGRALIQSVDSSEEEAHGTEIILLDVRPSARRDLQSHDRWLEWSRMKERDRAGLLRFHIGEVERNDPSQYKQTPSLPWPVDAPADKKFRILVDSIIEEVGASDATPSIAETLDNYLATLWALSLSAPLEYVETAPFDLDQAAHLRFYSLNNEERTPPEVTLSPGVTIGANLGVTMPGISPTPFRVHVDGVELKRPIVFRSNARSNELIQYPMMFVGSHQDTLTDIDPYYSGGKHLSLSAYFFFTSKVVPKENSGVLVRINNASGTLFDAKFMGFRTNERFRLAQIEAEIFIGDGLDAALNIDRESFNEAHPHYRLLANWIHRSLTRVLNRIKVTGARESAQRKSSKTSLTMAALDQYVSAVWTDRGKADYEEPPNFQITTDSTPAPSREGPIVIGDVRIDPLADAKKIRKTFSDLTPKLAAIAAILAAYDLLDLLTPQEQSELFTRISTVLSMD